MIHLRTGDEEMEAFTVALASVNIGCVRATADQVVAVGPVGEGLSTMRSGFTSTSPCDEAQT